MSLDLIRKKLEEQGELSAHDPLIDGDSNEANASKKPAKTNNGSNERIEEEFELSKLKPFPNHKFKPYDEKRLDWFVENIKEFGIIQPIIAMEENGEHFILSGHNRHRAAMQAGLTHARVIVKSNMTKEDAVFFVIYTNYLQRGPEGLTYSEKASTIFQLFEAIKSQGRRTDLIKEVNELINDTKIDKITPVILPDKPLEINENSTSGHGVQKLKTSLETIGEEFSLTPRNVTRYLRINQLIEYFLEKLDNEELTFRSAIELSFIDDKKPAKENQMRIAEVLKKNPNLAISEKQAKALRDLYESEKAMTEDKILKILDNPRLPKQKSASVSVPKTIVSKYFTKGESKKEITETINKALEMYFAQASEEESP